MNPLCTLRYSATHVDKHHMVFHLDAVDAYERKLVKQIEVASATVIRARLPKFRPPNLLLLSRNQARRREDAQAMVAEVKQALAGEAAAMI